MEHVVAQDGIDNVSYRDSQRREGNVSCPNAPAAPAPVTSLSLLRVGAPFSHQPPSAAMISADCTTSACRGKMRPVRKSWTSASESEQQSSTTYRL